MQEQHPYIRRVWSEDRVCIQYTQRIKKSLGKFNFPSISDKKFRKNKTQKLEDKKKTKL